MGKEEECQNCDFFFFLKLYLLPNNCQKTSVKKKLGKKTIYSFSMLTQLF